MLLFRVKGDGAVGGQSHGVRSLDYLVIIGQSGAGAGAEWTVVILSHHQSRNTVT